MKTVKTKKGTELPLVSLKGRDYLMVAYRLQWLTEDVSNYDITTDLILVDDTQTVAKATITLYDENGKTIRKAQATKRETKSDFNDHTEKAETAAIGRALAMVGFGTQHALADLDEGQRIVDSPLQDVRSKLNDTTHSGKMRAVNKVEMDENLKTTTVTTSTTDNSTTKLEITHPKTTEVKKSGFAAYKASKPTNGLF